MRHHSLAIAAAAAALLLPIAATAQQAALPGAPRTRTAEGPGEVAKRAPINGVLVLYGNERCPTDNSGNEIVVCEKRSAEEQFRVPKELREFQVTPQNEAWAARAQGTLEAGVGANSIGSCSTVGAAGATGCFAQQARAARKANNAAKAAQNDGR
ncbi:MAG TPA: hypothetical protein VM900_06030 [Sphingomonas sp.]|nr:hypothetical protein [Sphingomonas sp.]